MHIITAGVCYCQWVMRCPLLLETVGEIVPKLSLTTGVGAQTLIVSSGTKCAFHDLRAPPACVPPKKAGHPAHLLLEQPNFFCPSHGPHASFAPFDSETCQQFECLSATAHALTYYLVLLRPHHPRLLPPARSTITVFDLHFPLAWELTSHVYHSSYQGPDICDPSQPFRARAQETREPYALHDTSQLQLLPWLQRD